VEPRTGEQERPADPQPATDDGRKEPADRELSQSELDKVSGGLSDHPIRNLRG
jgi:hypothetical protein